MRKGQKVDCKGLSKTCSPVLSKFICKRLLHKSTVSIEDRRTLSLLVFFFYRSSVNDFDQNSFEKDLRANLS